MQNHHEELVLGNAGFNLSLLCATSRTCRYYIQLRHTQAVNLEYNNADNYILMGQNSKQQCTKAEYDYICNRLSLIHGLDFQFHIIIRSTCNTSFGFLIPNIGYLSYVLGIYYRLAICKTTCYFVFLFYFIYKKTSPKHFA